MSDANHIIEAIDNALRDVATSKDAMRWAPTGQADEEPPDVVTMRAGRDYRMGDLVFADGGVWPGPVRDHRRNDPRSPWHTSPPPCGQIRTTLTSAELQTWIDQSNPDDTFDLSQPWNIPTSRPFPPCPGCGGPVHPGDRDALTVITSAYYSWTATFHPCGCVLTVQPPSSEVSR